LAVGWVRAVVARLSVVETGLCPGVSELVWKLAVVALGWPLALKEMLVE